MVPNRNRGIIAASLAYFLWGIFPFYWKLIAHVNAVEILAHRIIWSALTLLFVLVCLKKLPYIIQSLKSTKHILRYLLSAVLIALNWGLYIYAVLTNQTIEGSLGYFICPIFVVVIGRIFLHENLSRSTIIALIIVSIGVIARIIDINKFPWIAISLAVTFSFYGLVRKRGNLDSLLGLSLETILLFPIAAIGLFIASQQATIAFGSIDLTTDMLLIFTGVMTSLPLLFYGDAVRHATFSTLGFLQYIAPTMQFITGVYLFNEPFSKTGFISFSIIWLGLLIFVLQPFQFKRKLA